MKNQLMNESSNTGLRKQENFGLELFSGKFPYFDIEDHDTELCLIAEVPGLTEKNVRVTFRDGLLILEGERQGCTEESFDNYYYCESWSGSFARSFPLGEGLDTSKAETSCRDGRLVINIPKKQKAGTTK